MALDRTTGGGALLGTRSGTLRAVTILVGAALVASGCNTDREVTQPEPLPVTEKRLTSALLTEEDVPDTFAPVAEPTPVNAELIPEHECDDAIANLDPEESASVDFSSGTVLLSNSVSWFPGGGAAVEDVFRDIAEDCEAVVADDEGVAIRTGPLDFGALSDDTLALQIEIEPTTGTGAIEERDVIVMRDGDLVSIIRLTGPRPSDKELLDSVVRTALGNLGLLADETS
jgi:hypothetical protein